MKKYLTFLSIVIGVTAYGQTNTFPASGYVGIGTLNPPTPLNVVTPANGTISAIKIGQASDPGNINVPLGAAAGGYNIDFAAWRDIVPDYIGGRIRAERINVWQDNNALVQAMDLAFFTGDASSSISEKLRIKYNGNIGIGTTTPLYKLTLAGGDIKAYNYDNNSGVSIGAEGRDMPRIGFHVSDNTRRFKIQFSDVNQPSERLGIFTSNGGALPEVEAFSVVKAGNVGIGITNPQQKLAVNGTIQAKEVNVTTVGWPDYVFTLEHKLPSLETLAIQIKEQGHLPNIPSAEEVNKNGIALGEMNKKLLEKVEELTLYVIKQNEKSKQQEEQIKTQDEESKQQKELIEKLQQRLEKLESKK